MRKSFPRTENNKRFWKVHEDCDKVSLGNLDLVNLRLNLPSNTGEQESPRTKFFGGSGDSSYRSQTRYHHRQSIRGSELQSPRTINHRSPREANGISKTEAHKIGDSSEDVVLLYSKDEPYRSTHKVITAEPISKTDFLFPTKKRNSQKAVDVIVEKGISVQNRVNKQFSQEFDDNRSFPFKRTPSGNLKVASSQVVFASKKLSVLVADPKNTRVNFTGNNLGKNLFKESSTKMAQELDKNSPMQTIINQQGGFSSLGSLIANTPVRSQTKEAMEYESKQTNEILDPELNLGRLGYNGTEQINWDNVKLPEKQNLYLELYHRITNNTNADCKIYIDNEEFNCHLIVLQCYSELFDNYVAVKKVELPSDKCSVTAFSFIYEWMITGEPSYINLNRENVLDIFNSAKYLKIKDLVEQCWAFIDNMDVFNEDTAFLLYMDAKKRNLPEVKELMLPRIQSFFLMLVSSQDWLELDIDDVKNLLKSNYIKINCEIEIFMSAVRWLRHDWTTRDRNKYEVLDCVRFGNIAPWQLVDIKRNPENPDFMELAKDLKICKMIDDGLAYVIIRYWYGHENEDFLHWTEALGLQEPSARNWIGGDRTYFTYRDFLIFLDQYRRTQLLEKNKPRLIERSDKKPIKEATFVSEKSSPRVPTMEEFMSKKKSNQQKKINKVMS